MDIDSLLKEDTFFEKFPLVTRLPKELFPDNHTIRHYQGYIIADVSFDAYKNEKISIDEEIYISIPHGYPRNIPRVFLLEKGIVANYGADFHFYNNSQLCLGLNWEIREELYKDPSLLNLTKSFIIPHLAATRYVMQCPTNRSYPQGEYSHAITGKIEGIARYFNISQNVKSILSVLKFLSKPLRVANKMLCPFGCGAKYGICQCKGNFKELQKLFPSKEIIDMHTEVDKLRMKLQLQRKADLNKPK